MSASLKGEFFREFVEEISYQAIVPNFKEESMPPVFKGITDAFENAFLHFARLVRERFSPETGFSYDDLPALVKEVGEEVEESEISKNALDYVSARVIHKIPNIFLDCYALQSGQTEQRIKAINQKQKEHLFEELPSFSAQEYISLYQTNSERTRKGLTDIFRTAEIEFMKGLFEEHIRQAYPKAGEQALEIIYARELKAIASACALTLPSGLDR